MDHPELPAAHEAVLEHVAWMRQLASELVRDPGTADDLVQETWLAFLRAKPDTDRSLRPWLSRVARNAAALRLRRGASRSAREADVAAPEQLPSAHQLVERAEEQQRLGEAVLALDEPYRTVVLLRYYEGLTPQQIAKAQGLPSATVRSQLHRGLAKLRERLDREHGGDRRAWVLMLKPLWSDAAAPAAAGSSGGVMIGVGLVATACLWFGVTWALRAASDRPLEPDVEFAATAVTAEVVIPSGANDRVVIPRPVAARGSAEREWRLVDARSQAPLAEFLVRVEGEERSSDSRGVVSLPAHARTVVPVDDVRTALDVLHRHERRRLRAIERDALSLPLDRDALDLPLEVGPTYQLELLGADGVDPRDFTARLVVEGLSDESSDLRPRQVAPVRVSERPWVRFAERPSGAAHPEARWRLELRDAAGLRFGSTELTALDSVDEQVVSVELLATGTLAGHVSGLPPERIGDATVSLRAPDGRFVAPHFTQLDAQGDYELRWVPAGAYELHVVAPGRAACSNAATVTAGERTTLDCSFDATPPAGPVGGTIVSESGSYEGQLLVFLFDANGFALDVFPTTWKQNSSGALEAAFRFDFAPVGELHLDVLSLADAVTFRVDVETFAAPLEDLRVTLLDERPFDDWSFEVRDARSREALAEFEVEVRVAGGEPRRFRAEALERESEPRRADTRLWTTLAGNLRWNRFEGVGPLRRLPTDAEVRWTIRAEGFLDANGTESSFEVDPTGFGRVARVLLQPD